MARALDSAAAGTPIHQLVAGEAGVGKSRLVLAATEIAIGPRDARRSRAAAPTSVTAASRTARSSRRSERSLGRSMPRSSRRSSAPPDQSWRDSCRRSARPSWSTHAPRPNRTRPACSTRSSASSSDCPRSAPVLFVIEDLHWADPATRETIAFLIRQLRTDRVVLVMTFRADELHRRHPLLPWLAELERGGRVERLDLHRLDPGETAALLAAILGAPPHAELVAQIHRRSDGNPFFVEELLGAGEDAADGRLPPTLREVLLARIVALPEPAQAVIGVAAVAGRRVDHDLLARVAAMDRADLLDAPADGGRQPGAGDRAGERLRRGRLRVPPRAAPGGRLRRPPARRAAAAPSCLRRGARRARAGDRRDRRRPLGRAGLPLVGRPRRPAGLRGVGPGRARRRRRRSPSPMPAGRTSARSSCGRRSTARGRGRDRPGRAPRPGGRWRPGCPATPGAASPSGARPWPRSARCRPDPGRGRCSNGSGGRCGPTARPRQRSRPTSGPWRSCRPTRRRPSWRASCPGTARS